MALVELTRFDDLQEAQIAAGALDAAGIPAICHDLGYGSVDFLMRRATQGFGLWVEASDRQAARTFLGEHRTVNPQALAWRAHPQVLSGLPLALAAIIEPNTGWMIVSARQRPTAFRIGVTLLVWLPIAVAIAYIMLRTGEWLAF